MFLIAIKKNAGRRSCGYKRRRHKTLIVNGYCSSLYCLKVGLEIATTKNRSLASLYLVGPAFNALCLKTSLFLLTCTLNSNRLL